MPSATISRLADSLAQSRNATLLLGAGISIPNGVPSGYELATRFGEAHESELTSALRGLLPSKDATDEAARRFAEALVQEFRRDRELQGRC